ncbi:MAG: hypothetical protein ACXWG0_00680 [Chthoniobacterales bacterium]
MNGFLPHKFSKLKISALIVATISTAALTVFAARPEATDDEGVNLVPLNAGGQIECITPDGRTELLSPNKTSVSSAAVLRDETLSCPLQQGLTTFVIKLPGTALLDRFTFVNENAAASGELKISVSNYQLPASSPKWVAVDGNITFSHKRLFNLSMLGVEARYVKLSFNVESGGRVTSLNLYGGKIPQMKGESDFAGQQFGLVSKVSRSHKNKREFDFDFAALRAKGHVVHVSSGNFSDAPRMLDENNETAFPFAKTDARPTAIVELANTEEIHRVRALYKSARPGRFDVFLLEDISKSATDLNYRRPIASATTDEDNDGIAAVDFDPQGVRYVAVRFTPADASANTNPFEIVEINAYGDVPFAMLDSMEAPGLYAQTSATVFPGEGRPEISTTTLGGVAVPPILPVVSP